MRPPPCTDADELLCCSAKVGNLEEREEITNPIPDDGELDASVGAPLELSQSLDVLPCSEDVL